MRIKEGNILKASFQNRYCHYEFIAMHFRLANGSVAFMDIMSKVFQPFLDLVVVVFIDDILVYSRTIGDHESHLRLALETLKDHPLFAKLNKCEF